nr:MAG TPA: hypothetical protein [Bacteriophage sp.]
MNNHQYKNINKNKSLFRCGGSPKKSKNCRKPRARPPVEKGIPSGVPFIT